jgi:hypothetical protein
MICRPTCLGGKRSRVIDGASHPIPCDLGAKFDESALPVMLVQSPFAQAQPRQMGWAEFCRLLPQLQKTHPAS